MSEEATEHITKAEGCLGHYDLTGAEVAYNDAWDCLVDRSGLDAARLSRGAGNLALLRGQYRSAEVAYHSARKILAELVQSHADVRTEVMRCAVDEGQLNLLQGRLTSASKRLGEAIDLMDAGEGCSRRSSPSSLRIDLMDAGEGVDEVRLRLAELLIMRPGGREDGEAVIEDVKTRWLGMPKTPDLAARLHEAQGLLLAALGEHTVALAEFNEIVGILGTNGDALLRARTSQNRASVLLAKGELGEAGGLITEAFAFYQNRSLKGLQLSAMTDGGLVKLALGDLKGASKSFADREYGETDDFNPRERARNLDGWGNACQATGDLEAAAAKHRAALEYMATAEQQEEQDGWQGEPWGQVDRARVLAHLAVDHLLTYRLRYVQRAQKLLVEARDLLAGVPGADVDSARCQANLGVVYALLDDVPEAERCLAEASDCFSLNGRMLEQAAANHNRGCVIAQCAEGHLGELHRALDLLVPAALIRDSVRFALQSSDQRTHWAQQATHSVAESLRVAMQTHDSRLMTDLILVFRLPGRVTFSDGEDLPSTWFAPIERVALSPAALLRLARGPRIRVPAGRVALGRYIARAEREYHCEVRTGSVAVVAGVRRDTQRSLGSDFIEEE